MVHIYNVQTATIAAEVGRLFKDVAALPTWPGALTTPGKRESGGGAHTVSDASLVLNTKWHSSSSAFPPPPCHSLLLFCLMFFRVCADSDELDRTVASAEERAHGYDASAEMRPPPL